MTSAFLRARSEKLCKLYEKYRSALDNTKPTGEMMPYDWLQTPSKTSVAWMPYFQMLEEYAVELANSINDLTDHVHRLEAWDSVVLTLDDEDRLLVSDQFVDVLGIVAMGQPYAIRARFAFAAGHLCHQANQAADGSEWLDDFPDDENLNLNDIEPYCAKWKAFRTFKRKIEPISGKDFKNASNDFRNAYNHRFPTRFLIGVTGTVKRSEINGVVSYGFGGNSPLELSKTADLLKVERDKCYQAFSAFQNLINQHIDTITTDMNGGKVSNGGRSP